MSWLIISDDVATQVVWQGSRLPPSPRNRVSRIRLQTSHLQLSAILNKNKN